MKKAFFSLAFLFLIIVTYGNASSQSLSSLLKLNIAEESSVNEQKDKLTLMSLNEDEKKNERAITDADLRKPEDQALKPSSSRLSIGIGKALFEKYIK